MTDVDLQAAIVAIAAQGLVGAAVDLPRGPLSDRSWGLLLDEVRRHGLEAHLVEVMVRGHLRASDGQREQAQRAHLDAQARALLLQNELLRSVDVLSDACIDYRLSKGSALAHLVYANPPKRSVAPAIDLLVPSQDLDAAVRALAARGAELAKPLRHGFNRRFGKAVSFKLPSGLPLNLYRTLAPGPFGARVGTAGLFETRTTCEVGGRMLLSLRLEELLIQMCHSAVLCEDPPRLVSLRDVAELCLSGGIDAARVERLAARWSGMAVLSRGIALAWETFGLADIVPLSVRANRYLPTRREQRLLGRYELRMARTLPATSPAPRFVPGVAGKLPHLAAFGSPIRFHLPGFGSGVARDWLGQAFGRLARNSQRGASTDRRRPPHSSLGGK